MISSSILNKFPRSEKYDFNWMAQHEMGPNSVWLTEFLTDKMSLKKGMRVLDLGCGKACSSIFLAKEYDVNVWATDLWIDATTMFLNIKENGQENSIFPIHANARKLPYANEYFDAITSIDAYVYFGTDDFYLSTLLNFLEPGGEIGIIIAAMNKEVDQEIINHFGDLWTPEMTSFHSLEWWQNHWNKTGLVDITNIEYLTDAWQMWQEWESELEAREMINPMKGSDIPFIKRDDGKYMEFLRIVAKKK